MERGSRVEWRDVIGWSSPANEALFGPLRGFVVAAEGDLIGVRLIGTQARKETVPPILLDGTDITSFPYLLHGRVYADFRVAAAYSDR